MHFGIISWENMKKIEGTYEYNGECKDYDTAPTSYLWIAAMYTAIIAVVLSGVIAVLFWTTTIFSLTFICWKTLLLMDLVCSFIEILTIVFYMFGNGCLGSDEGALKCSLSEGGMAALGAVTSLLLTYAAIWFFPPFVENNHKDKLGESSNKVNDSRGIELKVRTTNAGQTEEKGNKREVLSSVNAYGKISAKSLSSTDSESTVYVKLSTGTIGYDKNVCSKEEEEEVNIMVRRRSSGLDSIDLEHSELTENYLKKNSVNPQFEIPRLFAI